MKAVEIMAKDAELELAVAYLMDQRCPYCVKRRGNPAECGNRIVRSQDGWRCFGFRSRGWDEQYRRGEGG